MPTHVLGETLHVFFEIFVGLVLDFVVFEPLALVEVVDAGLEYFGDSYLLLVFGQKLFGQIRSIRIQFFP